MRWLFVVTGLLLASTLVGAQQGQDPNAAQQLDAVLAGWEKSLTGLQSLYAEHGL